MNLLSDVVFLSRFQFAMTVAFHFIFVPLSIGLGLIMALAETRYYRSRDPKDKAGSKFWLRIFTATFAIGVATGITMEFAFGANWADYSRFVGDIFGAPLAAEALFAFFLESTFLGVLLFGRRKVKPKTYMVSSWVVWAGSLLSALWILIANSWMQTPAGYKVIETATGSKAQITDFWAAAFNPSTGVRYFHTVDALLIMGAFVAIAVAAYHLRKGKYPDFAKKTLRTATVVAIITVIAMGEAGHQQAVEVSQYQPEKLAALDGQWESGVYDLHLFGYVDEANQETHAVSIPGFVSLLASGSTSTTYPGINDYAEGDVAPVAATFTTYHTMIIMYGVMFLVVIVAWLYAFKKQPPKGKGGLRFLQFAPAWPIVAIMCGWMVAEIGRQPWIVWHELRTTDAISQAVSAPELIITISIFLVIYTVLFIAWLRIVMRYIKAGPVLEAEDVIDGDGVELGAERPQSVIDIEEVVADDGELDVIEVVSEDIEGALGDDAEADTDAAGSIGKAVGDAAPRGADSGKDGE